MTTSDGLRRTALIYLALVLGVVIASRIGLWPGVGQEGEGFFDHPYRMSMMGVTLTLAVFIGLWSGVFGAVRENIWVGLAVLFAGGAATGVLLWLTPWILYPGDRYSVAMMWLLTGAPVGVVAWAGVSVGSHLQSSSA